VLGSKELHLLPEKAQKRPIYLVSKFLRLIPWIPINLISVGLSAAKLALLFSLPRPNIEKDAPMKIMLNQDEIVYAIVEHIREMDVNVVDNHIHVNLNVSSSGVMAEVELITQPFVSVTDTDEETKYPCEETCACEEEELEVAPEEPEVAIVPAPTGEPVDHVEADRDRLKEILDASGVAYAPKARTSTLVGLVDDLSQVKPAPVFDSARPGDAPAKEVEAPEEDTVNIFAPVEETPPFNLKDASVVEPVDEDKPLFGN
jgi:hypothetical protein